MRGGMSSTRKNRAGRPLRRSPSRVREGIASPAGVAFVPGARCERSPAPVTFDGGFVMSGEADLQRARAMDHRRETQLQYSRTVLLRKSKLLNQRLEPLFTSQRVKFRIYLRFNNVDAVLRISLFEQFDCTLFFPEREMNGCQEIG